ncbi:MAG: 4-hydroxybenzoate octaprenyltransferase [Rickettsiales bacterium]|nr:4-hydroxybenzoate octaprenyltransferase [Rickettsiales bacterium]
MLKKFITTSRYNKPHGILLLYYPCIWGMLLTNTNISDVVFLCIIFFVGACGMRAAGCIWNDYNDRKFDKKVRRTRNRDIASGKVKKKQIIFFIIINLLLGSIPLFFFPKHSVLLSLCVIPLILAYPFMKRVTWWPQLWLGISYNWGIIIGFSIINADVFRIEMLLFYLGCVFWTLSYDTVYGFQDIIDDKKIGVKSTSIKFQNSPKRFITLCYLLTCILWLYSLIIIGTRIPFVFLIIILFFIIIFKLLLINLRNIRECHNFFISNSFFGFLITIILIYS